MTAFSFTAATRKALALAREAAMELGHEYVGTEHMLLGILRRPGAAVVAVLSAAGATPERIAAAVEGSVRRGSAAGSEQQLPYTSRSKKALEFAMREAERMKAKDVGLEHLLLGLLLEAKGIAAQTLASFGITREAVLRQLERMERTRTEPASRSGDPDAPVWFLELDASSGTPIYEQIVARVEEAVATGRLEPEERLPTVRQLAEELGTAPGTVARAYTELERRGVIVTAGARGTRVAQPKRTRPESGETIDGVLEGLLRPVAVAAFHMGATADQLRTLLERAMKGILKGVVLG